jgi:hypothetical protein
MDHSHGEANSYLELLRRLAEENGVPVEHALELYAMELKTLEATARVKSFLPLFAIKRVKDLLGVHR